MGSDEDAVSARSSSEAPTLSERLEALPRDADGSHILGEFTIPSAPSNQAIDQCFSTAETSGSFTATGQEVQVLLIDPVAQFSNNDAAQDFIRYSFLAQASALKKEQHPGLPKVLAFGEFGEALWAATDSTAPIDEGRLLELLVLDTHVDDVFAARLAKSLEIMEAVAERLVTLHKLGLTHRLIGPYSIRRTKKDQENTAGIVLAASLSPGKVGLPVDGTDGSGSTAMTALPGFSPQEMLTARGETSATVDIFGVGALGYYLIAGVAPFSCKFGASLDCPDGPPVSSVVTPGSSFVFRALTWLFGERAREKIADTRSPAMIRIVNTISGHVHDLETFAPQVPKEVSGLIMRCLKGDPANRPQSANQLRTELKVLRATA